MSETKCEVCWRGYTEDDGHLTGERGPAACYRLGYERLREALKRFTDHVEQQIRAADVPSIPELRRAQAALVGNAAEPPSEAFKEQK